MNDEATIYLIDADQASLESLTALVQVVFPRVKAFSSATDFLNAYCDCPLSCLVLDVRLPEMHGIELQRKLLQEKVELPVIFVTGHGTVAMAVEAMRLGAINFLEKPVHRQVLWDSIRKAIELSKQRRQRLALRRKAAERLACLKPSEREVLDLILEGKMNKEIAAELGCSIRTIEDRRARIMRKMEVASLVELIQLLMMH